MRFARVEKHFSALTTSDTATYSSSNINNTHTPSSICTESQKGPVFISELLCQKQPSSCPVSCRFSNQPYGRKTAEIPTRGRTRLQMSEGLYEEVLKRTADGENARERRCQKTCCTVGNRRIPVLYTVATLPSKVQKIIFLRIIAGCSSKHFGLQISPCIQHIRDIYHDALCKSTFYLVLLSFTL